MNVSIMASGGGSYIKSGDEMVLLGEEEVVGLGWMLSWNLLGRVWYDAVIFGDEGIGFRSVAADNMCQKVFKKDFYKLAVSVNTFLIAVYS
jgi:hypothetical protein